MYIHMYIYIHMYVYIYNIHIHTHTSEKQQLFMNKHRLSTCALCNDLLWLHQAVSFKADVLAIPQRNYHSLKGKLGSCCFQFQPLGTDIQSGGWGFESTIGPGLLLCLLAVQEGACALVAFSDIAPLGVTPHPPTKSKRSTCSMFGAVERFKDTWQLTVTGKMLTLHISLSVDISGSSEASRFKVDSSSMQQPMCKYIPTLIKT